MGFELTTPCASYLLGMGTDKSKSSALPTELNSHPTVESRTGQFERHARNQRV